MPRPLRVLVPPVRYRPHDRRWYERRLTGIGGSEAGAAVGISRWQSRRGLIETKGRRLIPDPEAPERLRLRLGREMEPILREHAWEKLQERYGDVPRPRVSRRLYRSPRHPFVIANIDGLLGDAILEAKTDAFGFEPWGPEDADWAVAIPPAYAAQVQHNIEAADRDRAFLIVMIGLGQEERLYEVPRDQAYIDNLVAVEGPVWDRVMLVRERIARLGPEADLDDLLGPVDGSDQTERYLRRRFPVGDGEIRTATATDELLMAEFRDGRIAAKRLELQLAVLQQRIEDLIGTSEGLSGGPAVGTITWSRSKDSTSTEHGKVEARYRQLLEEVIAGSRRSRLASLGPAWEALVAQAGPALGQGLEAIRLQFTKPAKGARRLEVPRSWTQGLTLEGD